MFASRLGGLNRSQLRLALALFFVALMVPTGLLIYQGGSDTLPPYLLIGYPAIMFVGLEKRVTEDVLSNL